MMRHYPDVGSASDWSCCMGNWLQPIRSTTQIWVVMHHQYGILTLVSLVSFGRETSAGITKCLLFSQATEFLCSKSSTLIIPVSHVLKIVFVGTPLILKIVILDYVESKTSLGTKKGKWGSDKNYHSSDVFPP